MKKSKAVGLSLLWVFLFSAVQAIISGAASIGRVISYVLSGGNLFDFEAMLGSVGNVIPPVLALSNIVCAAAVFVIARFSSQGCFEAWGIKKLNPKGITVSFAFLSGVAVVASALLGLINFGQYASDSYNQIIDALSTDNIITAVSTVALAPICEEFVFRGAIFNTLQKSFSVKAAAVISSLLFSFVHFNIIQSAYVFVIGLLLCLVYKKFESIWCTVAAHIGFNLFGGYILFDSLPRPAYVAVVIIWAISATAILLWMVKTSKKTEESISLGEQ